MENIQIDDKNYEGLSLQLPNSRLLLIKGDQGFVGCAYFDIEIANKIGELLAVVSGVKNFNEMLEAKVIKVSNAAAAKGVTIGMSGKIALMKINE